MLRKINVMTLAFILAVIAVSTTLTDTTVNRNAFYISALFSVIVLLIRRPQCVPREVLFIFLGVLSIGISQLLWHYRFPVTHPSPLQADNDYFTTALRLITGAVLIFAMGTLRNSWGKKTLLMAKCLIVIGFFYTSCTALYHHIQTPNIRLQINTVSTMAAYIYVLQSLLTIYAISLINSRYRPWVIAVVILVTMWIILLTETRSSLALYPVILLLIFCRRRYLPIKMMLALCATVLLFASITSHFFQNTTERITGTFLELDNYKNGDGNSSLGARISMWKAGIDAITHHLGGQNATERLAITTDYINRHEGGNPEALRNLPFHLHNDVIEAGSLQGIIGILALLVFYILVFHATRINAATKPILLLVLFPTIVIGMVDTLFIDLRYVTNLTLLLALYLCLLPSECRGAGPNAG